jgi:hypothetical protein
MLQGATYEWGACFLFVLGWMHKIRAAFRSQNFANWFADF